MDPAPTQYIDRDGAALAYQVIGDGPVDVVHFYEAFQHLDLQLTDPDINYNVERMARFSRTVYFQRRGFGLSDHVPYVPTIEQQADDVLAIMDAVGMRRAALVGWFGTCGPLALVAARVTRPRQCRCPSSSPWRRVLRRLTTLHGWTDDERQRALEVISGCGRPMGFGRPPRLARTRRSTRRSTVG